MKNSDLQRSYNQFIKHRETGHLKLTNIDKVILSIGFVLLLPTVVLNLLSKQKAENENTHVLEYTNTQPYKTIYHQLRAINGFKFVTKNKNTVPILPTILLKDFFHLLISNPKFVVQNMPFFGALAYKLSLYNSLISKHRISKLIVLQEYSFYSSYFTRVMEHKGGKLYNIQHGIPGESYCYFRFSKCFIWGEHYRQEYIRNGADPSQFVIAGSVFHNAIKVNDDKYDEDVDILYVMQGYTSGKEEVLKILEILKKLSHVYNVKILQHPRHNVDIDNILVEYNGDIIGAIQDSKVVLSHYSTALLDAQYLNKYAIAYVGNNVKIRRYLSYLDEKQIISDYETLEFRLQEALKQKFEIDFKTTYLDKSKNPIKVIREECR